MSRWSCNGEVEKAKILGVTKVFNINNIIAVGGSGDADNVGLFVEHITQEFGQMSSTEGEFRDKNTKSHPVSP